MGRRNVERFYIDVSYKLPLVELHNSIKLNYSAIKTVIT